jgi:hypothetical protein
VRSGEVFVIRPHPDVRRWQRRGPKHRGRSPRAPAPYGSHRQGEDRTGERKRHPRRCLVSRTPGDGKQGLGAGPAVGKRRRRPGNRSRPWEHRGPGVQRAPTPVGSRLCGTWKPRRGPGVPGKPTARKAEALGGTGWSDKPMPAGRKATGSRGRRLLTPAAAPEELAGYGHMPGPKGSRRGPGEPLEL